ncbi:hypothetical protein ACJZ2D_016596 [Fusarium nematophilum]
MLGFGLATVRLGHRGRLGGNLVALAIPLQITGPIDPRRNLRNPLLVLSDLVVYLQGQADVIETVDEAVLPELANVELGDHRAGRVPYNLVREGHGTRYAIYISATFNPDHK